jgi:hypothetical protein
MCMSFLPEIVSAKIVMALVMRGRAMHRACERIYLLLSLFIFVGVAILQRALNREIEPVNPQSGQRAGRGQCFWTKH